MVTLSQAIQRRFIDISVVMNHHPGPRIEFTQKRHQRVLKPSLDEIDSIIDHIWQSPVGAEVTFLAYISQPGPVIGKSLERIKSVESTLWL